MGGQPPGVLPADGRAARPAARRAAPAASSTSPRGAHVGARIDFDDLQGERKYGGDRAYGQSKLANVLFTYELARRLEGSGVTANCLHPGVVAHRLRRTTDLSAPVRPVMSGIRAVRDEPRARRRNVDSSRGLTGGRGRVGQVLLARKAVRSSPDLRTTRRRARLWQLSEEMTGNRVAANACDVLDRRARPGDRRHRRRRAVALLLASGPVPWAEAGVGAVATQASARPRTGRSDWS